MWLNATKEYVTMLDGIMESYGSRFFIAAGGVAIGLLVLVAVLWIMRNRAPSPFVRGGRNRQPRLQVLDAAAVDARRRLVLVRRDDVEHLVMIGGPTDIVIESRILPAGASEPEQSPARSPSAQPVMIAAAESLIPPAPKTVMARTSSPVEEYAPEPEPAPVNMHPVAPQAEQRQAAFEAEMERAPRPAPPVEARVEPLIVTRPPVAAQPPATTYTPLVTQPTVVSQPAFLARPEPAPIEASAAADILDSARQRVLSPQRIEPQVMSPPMTPAPNPYAVAPVQPAPPMVVRPIAPSAQPSDFQRVLEEEMTTNLAAERVTPPPAAPVRPAPSNLPRRDPEMAPMTGADAALQNEVARIFGEMSVNRDK
jgi:hypothetical protein